MITFGCGLGFCHCCLPAPTLFPIRGLLGSCAPHVTDKNSNAITDRIADFIDFLLMWDFFPETNFFSVFLWVFYPIALVNYTRL